MEKDLEKLINSIDSSNYSNDDPSINSRSEFYDIDREIKREELNKLRIENEARIGDNKSDSQDREQRREFAYMIFKSTCIYMMFVFLFLFLSGCNRIGFSLSDNVLITLLGTTTVNVIAIFIIVVTYIFSRKR